MLFLICMPERISVFFGSRADSISQLFTFIAIGSYRFPIHPWDLSISFGGCSRGGDDNHNEVLFEAYYKEKLFNIMKNAIYTNAQLNGFNSEDVPHPCALNWAQHWLNISIIQTLFSTILRQILW